MALTKVSGEVIKRPLILTNDASISGILTVGTGSTTTTIDGSFEYPTIRPTLDLNFAATKTLDRRITFTRDSVGTYIDELGNLKYASNNVPRFDHDPDTGESLGLLIEESRTNRFVNSIPGTVWSKTNVGSVTTNTTTANYATAPDGTTTATRWQWNIGSTTSDRAIIRQGTGSLGSSTLVTLSIYLKSNTGSNQLAALHADGSIFASTYVTVTPEWKRFRYTYTSAVGINNGLEVKGGSGLTLQGDILVWGAQMEIGGFPTSYIPTSGSTVTRAADIAKITGTNFTSFYTAEEFTLYGDGRSITGSSDIDGNPAMVSIDDNTNSNRFILRRWDPGGATPRSGFTFRYYRSDISLNLDAFPHATTGYDATGDMPDWQDASLHKMAFAVNNNSQVPHDIAGYGDGYSANFGVTTPGGYTGTETLTPYTAAIQMQIGFGASSARWNGHISSIKYYPKRLSNAQLKGLTSQ
jgi:hypothetical protein